MKIRPTNALLGGMLLAASGLTQADHNPPGPPVQVVQGYVVHGVNVYNDKFVSDYSNATPGIGFLNAQPPLYEIGVLSPTGPDSEVINEFTDGSRLVATNGRFVELFGIPADPALFNLTLDQVGTNFFGFQSPTDRVLMNEFASPAEPNVYRREITNSAPTLDEWNQIRGVVRFQCRLDGSARVEVAIRDAFPNALYTIWDVGARNPLSAEESLYAVPLGGMPNAVQTNSAGCAHLDLEVPYCPGRPCEEGAASCSSYLSVAHHWDNQIYGASPAGSFIGLPVGAYAANHMVWPMSGEIQQPPSTKISGAHSRSLECPR